MAELAPDRHLARPVADPAAAHSVADRAVVWDPLDRADGDPAVDDDPERARG